MAKTLSPQEIADKQIRRSAAAVQDYKNGVANVEVNPMELAAQAVDKYAAGTAQAATDGSYVDGCMSISKNEWISKAQGKGADNYAKGVAGAREKIVDFQTVFAPVRQRVREQVKAMPNSTFEDRMARMEANARGLHEFRYKARKRRRA